VKNLAGVGLQDQAEHMQVIAMTVGSKARASRLELLDRMPLLLSRAPPSIIAYACEQCLQHTAIASSVGIAGSQFAKSRLMDASTVPEARSVGVAGSSRPQRTGWPSTASRSAIAWAGSPTLIVVMPIARAGLRLMPRSSRNTHSSGRTPTTSQARA